MSRTKAAGKVASVWQCTERDCDHYVRAREYQEAIKGKPQHERFTLCPDHPEGRMRKRRGVRIKDGLVDWDATRAQIREQGIELRGGAADEAPAAYKDLGDVLAAHGDTIRILHRLYPIGVAMAGPDVVDPFRD